MQVLLVVNMNPYMENFERFLISGGAVKLQEHLPVEYDVLYAHKIQRQMKIEEWNLRKRNF